MKLDLNQIKDITCGAVNVVKDETYRFYRFTDYQMNAYKDAGFIDFYNKTFAGAGIKLAFKTDTSYIDIEYKFKPASSREYGWFDVYENAKLIDHFGLEGANDLGHHYIELNEGEKEIEIYFPWSKMVEIISMTTADGSYVSPIKRSKKMLNFGDSITHGYDAIYSSKSYTNILSRLLDADSYNKGIGGDIFFPKLVLEKDLINPDYITIAYGTNDWGKCTPEVFYANATAFISNIAGEYSDSKIFVISPIWRGDNDAKTFFDADVTVIDKILREICGEINNVVVINGWNLVPHDAKYFSPDLLHPNDLGFEEYATNLYSEIKKYI